VFQVQIDFKIFNVLFKERKINTALRNDDFFTEIQPADDANILMI
jgi:hypothetical protein